jgi:hypothetical protein
VIGAACLAALVAASLARAAEESVDCPSGTHRVATDNPYEPFRCAAPSDESKYALDAGVGENAFTKRPSCPLGTSPVAAAAGSLQAYRCVSAAAQAAAPSGTRAPDKAAYARYSIAREIAFEYPAAFRVQDAWKEEVPTLYLQIDAAAAGKPVTITITRYAESQSTYQTMSETIGRDVEWQGAKDGGTQALGRSRARVTFIPGDTRSVYLPVSKDSYYSFVYSAPADSYDAYLPAFSRLLKSLTLAGTAP